MLADPGDHVEACSWPGVVDLQVAHQPARVVVGLTPDGSLRAGCRGPGIRVTTRRTHIGPRWSLSTSGSRGLAIVTLMSPSVPRAMLSG
jgi:hypothetical protein